MSMGSPIAKGNTGSIYRQGDRIIKVLREELPESEADREAAKQRYAHACGLPVPEIYEIIRVGDRPAIVMAHIEGSTLGDLLLRDRSMADEYMALSVDLQLKIHALSAPGIERMEDKLCRQIEAAICLSPDRRQALCAQLKSMQYDRRLCHGDYHVFNLILGEGGVTVIDWVDASAGDPRADACRTYMMYAGFSGELAELYLGLYLKKSGLSRAEIDRWAPIVAAARLSENLAPCEMARLLAIANEQAV
jgi:aminoglycoside phosphotransferase (APT) family kinase protein